ncbi:MAG TPA: sporulation protein YtfJ, partial [Candidatus Faecivivens stercoravium]|nr:sporulation protein YtfJ [Candidatus Faecivivens stercoravium]
MAQQNENVQNLMGVTMDKVRDMADPKAIIGDPIYTPDGTMIIPVSRVTYGFASG